MGKVVSLEELILQRATWKGNGQRLVFVPGCFDLIHPGHIRLLEQARDYGEIVAVGVLSDAAVSAQYPAKSDGAGTNRPVTPASERCEIVAAFVMVDFAFQFDPSELRDILARLTPDVVVEGSHPSAIPSLLEQAATENAINVVHIPFQPGYSTSLLIERIAQLHA